MTPFEDLDVTLRPVVGRPLEILLVEDSIVDARITISALRKGLPQHRLTLACDGLEALHFVRREGIFAQAPRPDVILLDLQLPKLDGMEVLGELKAAPDFRTIPVVVMTSSEGDDVRARCKFMEVDDYISKPVNVEAFLQVMKRLKKHLQADVIITASP